MQRMPILSDSDMSLFELKTRYVRNYLTFAGKNSKDYLLYLSAPGVYDSPEVDMELQAVPGKNGDIVRDNAKAGEHRFKNLDITYDAYQQRFANGDYNIGSNRILGYDGVDGKLVPNQDAWIIREIFERYVAGGSYSGICRALAEKGAKTLRGGKFTVEAVRYILSNETSVPLS